MSLSGGVDVILQELGLDLILQVSEESIISLLQRRGEERREEEKIVCCSKVLSYLHVFLYIFICFVSVM